MSTANARKAKIKLYKYIVESEKRIILALVYRFAVIDDLKQKPALLVLNRFSDCLPVLSCLSSAYLTLYMITYVCVCKINTKKSFRYFINEYATAP